MNPGIRIEKLDDLDYIQSFVDDTYNRFGVKVDAQYLGMDDNGYLIAAFWVGNRPCRVLVEQACRNDGIYFNEHGMDW